MLRERYGLRECYVTRSPSTKVLLLDDNINQNMPEKMSFNISLPVEPLALSILR